ncbi:MAG: hypothetical protein AUH85_16960 [Chloroflexi bacterium 13_1_40CM_4_68_4]|nr:MAG: hypothetical protein AUH85_16960 [Chloroflexi bacterium 13_1_40CM_4_68_4]
MSGLAGQHLAAIAFFAILLLFERFRRTPALALVRHPMFAYLARGTLVALYFAFAGIDPVLWLTVNAGTGVAIGIALAALLAIARRHDVVTLATSDPAMVAQAAYLALTVGVVEELIFRGAFVLVAAATPLATVLASVGSAVAYALWRAVTYRDRDPRSLAVVFAANVAIGVVAGLAQSLWPALIAHAAHVVLAGPPRAPARRAATPSAFRP